MDLFSIIHQQPTRKMKRMYQACYYYLRTGYTGRGNQNISRMDAEKEAVKLTAQYGGLIHCWIETDYTA